MSEIGNPLVARNRIEVGSNRPAGWSSLRLVVHRNSSDWLTYGLIETSWAGASALDSRVSGAQVLWTPENAPEGDLRLYALGRALWSLSQTQRR